MSDSLSVANLINFHKYDTSNLLQTAPSLLFKLYILKYFLNF